MSLITKTTFEFLENLAKNNNRDWFQDHKEWYTQSHEEMIAFAAKINELMATHDHIEPVSAKKSLFRIYRDVRFSKDKSPYKQHWAGSLKRASKLLRGGYYYHIEPGGSFIGAGFWGPNAEDLKLIRSHIAFDPSEIEKVANSNLIKSTFGGIVGEKLKNPPRGYNADDPGIEWLKHKQFIVRKSFSDKEVLSDDFAQKMNESFKAVRPFFDYMSEILTTNLNGEPLY